jgi:spore germination protein YaaH
MIIYRTKINQCIYDVAREYGISPIILSEINEIERKCALPEGFALVVPEPTRVYCAKRRDTVQKIAERFKINKNYLLQYNPELRGRDNLYESQQIILRQEAPTLGRIATLGYLFPDCSRERLIRMLPYISFIAICGAEISENGIKLVQDGTKISEIKDKRKLLRIFIKLKKNTQEKDLLKNIINAFISAKSLGFYGVIITGNETGKNIISRYKDEICKAGDENRLMLLFEEDNLSREKVRRTKYGSILSYEKFGFNPIPGFPEGEKSYFEKYAEENEPSRSFIELSSYGQLCGKYVTKESMRKFIQRPKSNITFDQESLMEKQKIGNKRDSYYLYESLENVKAKLDLVFELGFLGVAFDIAKQPISELYMLCCDYDIVMTPGDFFVY